MRVSLLCSVASIFLAGAAFAQGEGEFPATLKGHAVLPAESFIEAPADAPYVRPSMTVFAAYDPKAPVPLNEGKAGTHELYVAGMSSLALEQGGVECDVFPMGDEACAGTPITA